MIRKSIPSLLTLGNLVLGLIAIGLAGRGESGAAALLVVVGMVLDGLDGRVARLLHAESAFGKELDSLSDLVTFGVAPALIMYLVSLRYIGMIGIILAVLFPICGALRLARFNVQKSPAHYFVGLPITAAGGILATMTLYKNIFSMSQLVLPLGMLILSILMVSHVRYPNFKKVAIPKSAYIGVPLLAILVYLLFRFHYASVDRFVFAALALYALFGVGRMVRRQRKRAHLERDAETVSKS